MAGVKEGLRTGISGIADGISSRFGRKSDNCSLKVPTSPLMIIGPIPIGPTTIEAPPGKLDDVIESSRRDEQRTTYVTIFPGVKVRRRAIPKP